MLGFTSCSDTTFAPALRTSAAEAARTATGGTGCVDMQSSAASNVDPRRKPPDFENVAALVSIEVSA